MSWTPDYSSEGYWVCADQTPHQPTDTTCHSQAGWVANSLSPNTAFQNLAPGTYYWQVKMLRSDQTVYADDGVWASFTVGPPPGTAFVKSSPGDGYSLTGGNATLAWNAPDGSPGFDVCVDQVSHGVNDAQCSNGWVSSGFGQGQALKSFTTPGLAPGWYYWQVRSVGVEADGGVWRSFYVPIHLSKISPTTGSQVPNNSWATWSTIDSNTAYWVCWSTTPNACDSMWWPTGLSYQLMFNLVAGRHYYWQVRADNNVLGSFVADEGVWWQFDAVGEAPGSGPMVEGADGVFAGPSASALADRAGRVPDHCALDGDTVLCSTRTTLEAVRHRLQVHGVPSFCLWVDGRRVLSPLDVAKPGDTTADLDLDADVHVVQSQYHACSLNTTVSPEPRWYDFDDGRRG